MYYEEKIIEGILHYRTDPNGEWHPMSAERLTGYVSRIQSDLEEKNKIIEELEEYKAMYEGLCK